MKKIIPILCIAALSISAKPIREKPNDYLAEKSDSLSSVVGYTFAAFPVSQALYTDAARNRQYVAFFDTARIVNVAQRTLPDGPWKYVKLDECNPWDSHNNLLMTIDKRGVLHLTGNMHVKKLVYFCTDESGDISTLKRVPYLIGKDEDRVTYPKFIHLKNGEMLFHYRLGSSGNGIEIYDKMDAEGEWSRFLDVPLTDGQGQMNAYMSDPRMYKDGYFHMIWVWRDTPDCATNHDLSYARSKDLKNWETADGVPVKLPITIKDNQLIVDPIPCHGGTLNGGPVLGWDVKRRPVIGYFKYDEKGYTNLYVARFEKDHWNIRKVTDWKFRWKLEGGGSVVRELWANQLKNDSEGDIAFYYTRFDPKTSKKWSNILYLDQTTLEPIGEKPNKERIYPEWMDRLESTFSPDMQVNIGRDGAGGRRWFLRWETMPNNRDCPINRPFPEKTEIRVIQIK